MPNSFSIIFIHKKYSCTSAHKYNLLHTYNDVQGQQGENAETIRRDIAGILHTLNQAYSNLYDNLLSDVAMDVSSEIAALQGMLANDGLTGEGLL